MSLIPFPSVMMMQGEVAAALWVLGNPDFTPQGGQSCSSDAQCGAAYQSDRNITLNFMQIVGDPGNAFPAGHFRLSIYDAASQTVWGDGLTHGALLGHTAIEIGLGLAEIKKLPLIAPVPIVTGNWYALCIEAASPGMNTGQTPPGIGDRYFPDTFASGPGVLAAASLVNSNEQRCICATNV